MHHIYDRRANGIVLDTDGVLSLVSFNGAPATWCSESELVYDETKTKTRKARRREAKDSRVSND